jgi:type I restriction enzyme R subunit
VFRAKNNGLIVDYVGVFRNLQKALAIYGSSSGGGVNPGECPIQRKAELLAALREAVAEALAFCTERGVDLEPILKSDGFQKIAVLDDAATRLVDKKLEAALDDRVERIIVNDDLKRRFVTLTGNVVKLYKAILPDPAAMEFAPVKTCLAVLAEKIRSFLPEANIDDLMDKVDQLLDESIATVGYVIHATEEADRIDLSQIDFEALKAHFDKGRKRTEAEKLKAAVGDKLAEMVLRNKTRADLVEKFKKLIEEYNKGLNVETFFAKLMAFAKELNTEDKRGVSEQLTEEELAVFDLLTRPEIEMTAAERKTVKAVARKLLQTLKQAKLVLDWRKKQQTRAAVYSTVKTVLDDLPRVYSKERFEEKCEAVFRHVYDSYSGEGRSVYGAV